MKKFTTKRLCRAGMIAALYAALTLPFGALAYGNFGFQIRPAEALTVLPLFFAESIPALYVGCLLANLLSGLGAWDIALGSLCSLVAAALTFGAGKLFKNTTLKLLVGGAFPVLVNAFCIPLLLLLAGSVTQGYWLNVGSTAITQTAWVYGLGTPLFLAIRSLQNKGVSAFCDNQKGAPLKRDE